MPLPSVVTWGLRSGFAIAVCALSLFLLAPVERALAQGARADDQQSLYERMLREPTNYPVTYAYVAAATNNGDYEAAIGALERLLFYNPNLPQVKYQLGTLYFRLRAFDLAKRYFREALASPGLDAETKARIDVYLPDTEKQTQQSRFSGFAQTGVRYQSNASFSPSSGIVRLGGADIGLPAASGTKADGNWFGLVGLSHDYDLNDLHGVTIESRFTGYLTDQFRLHELNVGIADGSFGPRLPIESALFPGASLKPYIAGGNIWVGGSQYLSSGGAGVGLNLPATMRLTVEPSFEWRRVNVTIGAPTLNEFNSGNWYTSGVSAKLGISEGVKLDTRAFYRRGTSVAAYQDFHQWVGEAALSIQVAPPVASIPRNWTVSPFARYIKTDFDAPNPFIDPLTTRADTQWITGVVFDTPITGVFGISTTVQYDVTASTLPNFRQHNYSILTGPTARF